MGAGWLEARYRGYTRGGRDHPLTLIRVGEIIGEVS